MAKVKYIGETFGAVSLTNGKIYECSVDEDDETDFGWIRVVDDSGGGYLYHPINPRPLDNSSIGGQFEIIEEEDGTITKLIEAAKHWPK